MGWIEHKGEAVHLFVLFYLFYNHVNLLTNQNVKFEKMPIELVWNRSQCGFLYIALLSFIAVANISS